MHGGFAAAAHRSYTIRYHRQGLGGSTMGVIITIDTPPVTASISVAVSSRTFDVMPALPSGFAIDFVMIVSFRHALAISRVCALAAPTGCSSGNTHDTPRSVRDRRDGREQK
jgi:hypothetical protein